MVGRTEANARPTLSKIDVTEDSILRVNRMFQWVVPQVAMISKSTEMLKEIKLAINSGKFTKFSSIFFVNILF